jgi:hypothetical protein
MIWREKMLESFRRTVAPILTGLLLASCSSIGNQQFYALEPTRELTVHNQEIYLVLTPDEYLYVEESLAAADEYWPIERMFDGYYQATQDGARQVTLLAANEAAIARAREREPGDASTRMFELSQDGAKELLAEISGLAEGALQRKPLLRRVEHHDELIAGDVVLTEVEIGERGGSSRARLFEFQLDVNGQVTTGSSTYVARRSHTLGVTSEARSSSWLPDWGCPEGSHELVELTITEQTATESALQTGVLQQEEDHMTGADDGFGPLYDGSVELSGSLTPRDAALPYRLVSPAVDTGNGDRIEPGYPLTIIANRLFLAEDGDPLLYLTGEIAVVATVTEGGAEPRSFLAAYHEKVDAMSFVPFWGAILYSTVSWSGEPITIKIQVLELDGQDNAYFSAILSAAAESAGTLAPALQPDIGIARTLGDTLISNNQDDEILRFELTFVHDSSEESIGTLVPRNRSYVVLRPQSGKFINPSEVDFTDQWQLQPRNRDHWRDAWTDAAGKPVEHYDFMREWVPLVNRSPPPPSYVSVTASDSIVIPEAVMQAREQDLSERIASFSPDSSSGDQLGTLEESLNRLASAPLYVSILRQVLQLPTEDPIDPATWNEIASIAGRLAKMYPKTEEGEKEEKPVGPRLTPPDLDALRVVLKGRFPSIALDGDWNEIARTARDKATGKAKEVYEVGLGRMAYATEATSKFWEDALTVAHQVEGDGALSATDRAELYGTIAGLLPIAEQMDRYLAGRSSDDLGWPPLVNALEQGLRDARKLDESKRQDQRDKSREEQKKAAESETQAEPAADPDAE